MYSVNKKRESTKILFVPGNLDFWVHLNWSTFAFIFKVIMSKIYTKRGDRGTSDLFYTTNLEKINPFFEALGTIDELNSFIGLLACEIKQPSSFFTTLPHFLFDIGAILAMETCTENDEKGIREMMARCEAEIDVMTSELSPLNFFIVPGGSRAVSLAHICRAVTRRAERSVWHLDRKYTMIGSFLNRLSDYFFTLSRYINHTEGGEEKKWLKREER